MKRRQTLPFYKEAVPANTKMSLVTGVLNFRYTIKEIEIGFALNCQRLLQVKILVGRDNQVPVGQEPPGINVVPDYAQNNFFVGDDVTVRFPVDFKVENPPSWIKVYAYNTDLVDTHTLDVKVILEIEE